MPEYVVVESIFLKAIEQKTPEALAAFLDANCQDAATREEVERLIAADPQVGEFLKKGAFQGAETEARPISERVGAQIGPYRLMEQIGEGGFGLVFVAQQDKPVRRKVAIKVIKPGMDSREIIARFEAERQALALMNHPHIAKVLDAGATDAGRPYFVMELVKGVSVVEYCDAKKLDTTARLNLFVTICQAVQHAHSKGVIHRDLKPSNVMVALYDGRPVVKVIDFGVAKALGQQLTDKTIYTQYAQMIGTPLYMSPEQAEINALDVDTRSDVYSLGVLLYELLTGTTPFDRERFVTAAFDEMRRIIKEEEPPKPSTRISSLGTTGSSISASRQSDPRSLSKLIRGDLDWIAMKSMEKDRERRYESAGALASDVERFLREEFIVARPPSAMYRFRKFARRNKSLIGTAAAIVFTLVLGLVGTTWQAIRANSEERNAAEQRIQAEAERDRALEHAYAADMNLAYASYARGDLASTETLLEQSRLQQTSSDQRGIEWRWLWSQCQSDSHTVLGQSANSFNGVSASANFNLIAAAEWPNKISLFDLRSNHRLSTIPLESLTYHLDPVALSASGRWLAFRTRDEASSSIEGNVVVIWDVEKNEEVDRLQHDTRCNGIVFSETEDFLLTLEEWEDLPHRLNLWKGPFGTAVISRQWTLPKVRDVAIERWGAGCCVAISPDHQWIAAGTRFGGVHLIPLADGQVPQKGFQVFDRAGVASVAFSPDGQQLAVGAIWKAGLSVFDVERGALKNRRELRGHQAYVSGIRFVSSTRLISASGDQSIRVWNPKTGNEIRRFPGHKDEIFALSVNEQGTKAVSAGKDGQLLSWDLTTSRNDVTDLIDTSGAYASVTLSHDGRTAFFNSTDSEITSWDVSTAQVVNRWSSPEGRTGSFFVTPDGSTLVLGAPKGRVVLLDPKTLQVKRELQNLGSGRPKPIGLTEDQRSLVTKGANNTICLCDLKSGNVQTWKLPCEPNWGGKLKLANDELIVGWRNEVRYFDVRTGQERRMHSSGEHHNQWISNLCVSTARDLLVATSLDSTFSVYQLATRKQLGRYRASLIGIHGASFSPDGKRLLVPSQYQGIQIWDTKNWRKLGTIPEDNDVNSVVMSPDQSTIFGRSSSGIRIWRIPSWEQIEAATRR